MSRHAVLVLALAAGCAHARPSALAQLDDGWLAPGRVLLLGEVHRTRECPRYAAQVLDALPVETPVVLGLEIPSVEQPRLDQYLRDGDAHALLSGPFWQRDPGDGRESEAWFQLIAHARELSARRPLSILAIDAEPEGDRDLGMAHALEAARAAHPEALFVVLTGNAHATRRASVHKSLGWHLAHDGVPIASVNLAPGTLPVSGFDREISVGAFTEAPRAHF